MYSLIFGLDSVFFLQSICSTKAKESSLLNYLPLGQFMPRPRGLGSRETRIADSIYGETCCHLKFTEKTRCRCEKLTMIIIIGDDALGKISKSLEKELVELQTSERIEILQTFGLPRLARILREVLKT